MEYIVSASSDVGIVKETNQDSLMVKVIHTAVGKMVFAIVCDGIGGLQHGEIASATVVHAFNKWSMDRLPFLAEEGIQDYMIRNEWSDIITQYNQKIMNYSVSQGIKMGTTATVMLLTQYRYYILNVGDTRAYELTNTMTLLTRDHTLVAREVELGNLTYEEAENDSRRNVLLQCVGASEHVYPDLFFGVTKRNALYMLCSDGFRHEVKENEILHYLHPSIIQDATGLKSNMDKLIELNKQRQERDNISIIAIKTC